MSTKNINNYLTPIAIVVAGLIIATAVLISPRTSSVADSNGDESKRELQDIKARLDKLRPVSNDDHVRGAENPEVVLVEYSDFECPFCKRFHYTMKKILEEYNNVAWVYRHFPLEQLHPKYAKKAALASECAASLGGNDAFWKFTDKYFDLTPSNDQTNFESVIAQAADYAGINLNELNRCIDSKKFESKVQNDLANAIETGGRGTPWSIIVSKSGEKIPVNGALPYEELKKIIEYALQN